MLSLFQIGPNIRFPNLEKPAHHNASGISLTDTDIRKKNQLLVTGSIHNVESYLRSIKNCARTSWEQGRSLVYAPEDHEVLHHLLAQVVVYPVDLVLSEEGGEVGGQLLRALQVSSKRLLHNHPVPASTHHTQHRQIN